MNFYKHHIGDYRRDTAHLSLVEHGAYRQLLDTYYLHETPIPAETEQVFRRLSARTEDEQKAVLTVLSEFFTLTKDGYIHRRCDLEIREYQQKADTARVNGKLGGRPKKTDPVSDGLQQETQSKTESKANHEPRTKNQVIAPEGVDPDVWSDFVAVRKKRGALVTDRVIKGIELEAKKAGISLTSALNECVVRGWQSFKADWYRPEGKGGSSSFDLDSELRGAV